MTNSEQSDASFNWVVTVDFTIRPGFAEPFHHRLAAQAVDSLRETGCSRFDVCVDPADEHRIFLYEVYADREAFATHLASAHFKDFDAATRDWVGTKIVEQWRLTR
jgi:autoinducer 2-degrading protein